MVNIKTAQNKTIDKRQSSIIDVFVCITTNLQIL